MRMRVWSLASLGGLRNPCCHELWYGSQNGSDSTLLWLCCRLAAVALIRPLAWELPRAVGATLKRKKKKKNHPSFFLHLSWFPLCCTLLLTLGYRDTISGPRFLFQRKENVCVHLCFLREIRAAPSASQTFLLKAFSNHQSCKVTMVSGSF